MKGHLLRGQEGVDCPSVENSLLTTVNLLDGKTGVYSDGGVRGTKVGDDQEG